MMECKPPLTGYIHSTESFGTVDGPGIRMVVFFQGCPMRCLYCHNPDTWAPGRGMAFHTSQLLEQYEKNRTFYQKGGLTVTGGEPLLQLDFLTELFEKAKERDIHTCLDTSGICYRTALQKDYERLFRATDLILMDLKHSSPEGHKKLTGQPQDKVLAFLKAAEDSRVPVIIRHVVVAGLTDSPEELEGIGRIIASYSNIRGLEVLPYHNMGEKKYQELNLNYPLRGMENLSKEAAQRARQQILESITKYKRNKPS